MDTLLQDLRYALRMLRRSPGFTMVAVLTLALGIGLNTAIFSVVNGVLLRPLPFREPDQLVRLHHLHAEKAAEGGGFSPQDLDDVRAGANGFESLAAYLFEPGETALNLTGDGGEPAVVQAASVSKEFFPLLGVDAALGRTLRPEENVPGNDRVAVLSDGFWRSRYNADPAIVGRTVTLQGEPLTVVGVMPPSFTFPDRQAEVYVPISRIGEDDIPNLRDLRWMEVIGRLRPGTTPEAALGSVNSVLSRLAAEHAETNEGWGRARLETLKDAVAGPVRPALLVLLGTVFLVLLVACANLANLLLARASAREREVAIRTALGAGRGRLVRQMLTESVVLALMGGVLGLGLAVFGVRALLALSAGTIPRPDEVGVDGRVAVFALLLSLGTAVLFGLVPAIRTARGSTSDTLRDGGRGGSERRGGTTRAVLVLAQTAAAMVLLVGAGLMVNSFYRLMSVDPGFRTERVLVASLDLPEQYESTEDRQRYRNELIRRVGEIPGVEAVGASKTQPLRGGGDTYEYTIPGRSGPDAVMAPGAGTMIVDPGYFEVLRIPLLRGRNFTLNDDRPEAPAVMMINQAAARRYFPGADPVGQTVMLEGDALTVIGVVGDVRIEGLTTAPEPAVYFPYGIAPRQTTQIFIRTTGDPETVATAVRQAIHSVNPMQPIAAVQTLQSALSETVAQPRFFTLLLTIFGSVAVFLAALGLYGVVAYSVTRRTTEIGIRMALGARARDVVQMVVRSSVWPTALGILAGTFAALLMGRAMASMLFEVRPADPVTFGGAALLLASVAVVASWLPARRAARIEPTRALRGN